MNTLLTGATGFVGRALVEQLIQHGHAVHYLARQQSSSLPAECLFHRWASTDSEPDLSTVPAPDAVFNLAGEPIAQRWNREVKKRIYESRVHGTKNLVSALRKLKTKPHCLISTSAIGYYGDRGDEVLTEDQDAGDNFLAEVCAAWEREAFNAGIRTVAIRVATVLGAGGGALKSMLPVFRLGLGARFGNGRQWMSWIQLRDLVSLYLFAAQDERISGPVNGSSPQPVTNAVFTKALGHALDRPAVLAVPGWVLKIAMGEMSEFLFTSLRVLPEAASQQGFQFEFGELDRALQVSLKA